MQLRRGHDEDAMLIVREIRKYGCVQKVSVLDFDVCNDGVTRTRTSKCRHVLAQTFWTPPYFNCNYCRVSYNSVGVERNVSTFPKATTLQVRRGHDEDAMLIVLEIRKYGQSRFSVLRLFLAVR